LDAGTQRRDGDGLADILRLLSKVDERKADAPPSRAAEAFASNDPLSAPVPRVVFICAGFAAGEAAFVQRVNTMFPTTIRRYADFFCGKRKGITFPYSSGCIHFVAFFLKPTGTKNSMIFAIHHPTLVKTRRRRKSSHFDKSLQMRIVALFDN
jgi:hypothetical protein